MKVMAGKLISWLKDVILVGKSKIDIDLCKVKVA